MAQDPAGRIVLAHLGIDQFTMIADQVYTSARGLVEKVALRQ